MKHLFFIPTMMLVAFMAKAQSCPDENHPHAIDLGLPSDTKWACCNVGATTPEAYGSYFAWGETEEKEIYDWTTYIHCDGSMETCHDLGSDIAGTEYDAAHVLWGGSWVMPSQDQIKELTSKCSCTWTMRNGVGGDLFTGLSGGAIFLPEADFRWNSRINNVVIDNNDSLDGKTDELPNAGYYWSSSPRPSYTNVASYLLFSYGYSYWDSYNFRCAGFTIRPVLCGTDNGTTNMIYPKSSTDDACQAVYNSYGIKVADTIADMNTLPPGIYVVRSGDGRLQGKNSKKMVIK